MFDFGEFLVEGHRWTQKNTEEHQLLLLLPLLLPLLVGFGVFSGFW